MRIIITLFLLVVISIPAVVAQEKPVLLRPSDLDSSAFANAAFLVVEEMPQFPGGRMPLSAFIKTNLRYPEVLRTAPIEGKVIVQFLVKADGSLDQFKVLQALHPLLETEALRLLKAMPKWTPGRQRGQAVAVWYKLSIPFQLN